MSEEFYFLGLKGGWFESTFQPFHLFGYVGDRDRLQKELAEKSILRRLIEIFAPRFNIGTILKMLTSFDLLHVDPKKSVAQEIINIVNERENNRKLTELLQVIYRRGVKKGTYFSRVASGYTKDTLFKSDLNGLNDQIVTVEGQLVHRSSVSQFNRALASTLGASKGNWLLTDFPPQGLVPENSSFNGSVLLLREDPGFTDVFSKYLPFCLDVGWYPYVRITGFFDATRLQTEILPSLTISLVEYRRPKLFPEVRKWILDFGEGEIGRDPSEAKPQTKASAFPVPDFSKKPSRNFLKDDPDLLLFGYLAPILFRGSNLNSEDADAETAMLLRWYRKIAGNTLPNALVPFYSSLASGTV